MTDFGTSVALLERYVPPACTKPGIEMLAGDLVFQVV